MKKVLQEALFGPEGIRHYRRLRPVIGRRYRPRHQEGDGLFQEEPEVLRPALLRHFQEQQVHHTRESPSRSRTSGDFRVSQGERHDRRGAIAGGVQADIPHRRAAPGAVPAAALRRHLPGPEPRLRSRGEHLRLHHLAEPPRHHGRPAGELHRVARRLQRQSQADRQHHPDPLPRRP